MEKKKPTNFSDKKILYKKPDTWENDQTFKARFSWNLKYFTKNVSSIFKATYIKFLENIVFNTTKKIVQTGFLTKKNIMSKFKKKIYFLFTF